MSDALTIGIFDPPGLPASSRVYLSGVSSGLKRLGAELRFFSESVPLDGPVDLVWQPSAGRNGPHPSLRAAGSPAVVTFHGAANVTMTAAEVFGRSWRARIAGLRSKRETLRQWRLPPGFPDAIVAVSRFAAEEASRALGLGERRIEVIPHGVDHDVFCPDGPAAAGPPYFLHLSVHQPKKNLIRLVAAYESLRLPGGGRPRLVLVSPGFSLRRAPAGLELRPGPISPRDAAELYRGALGFVFPSLHETFGLPILEAMACGCPVIASSHPACRETAGAAALFVDPRSVEGIAAALLRLAGERPLREGLHARGPARAAMFAWDKSAGAHLALFRSISRRAADDRHR